MWRRILLLVLGLGALCIVAILLLSPDTRVWNSI